jgi:hypothetical protein
MTGYGHTSSYCTDTFGNVYINDLIRRADLVLVRLGIFVVM